MQDIEKSIRRLLHAQVRTAENTKEKRLPEDLRQGFELKCLMIEEEGVLFARPLRQMPLPKLRAMWQRLEEESGLPCVLCLEESTRYGRERMIELAIPFVMGEENVYLPFLGVALRKKRTVRLPQIAKLTPAAQKMVLTAIYENWQEMSCRRISEKMEVSRMTASRSLAELQALNLPLVRTAGREKVFAFSGSARQLLEMCAPYFDGPVAKTCYLEEIPQGADCLGGRSAAARYCLISDNPYITYALTREEYRALGIGEYQECARQDAVCAVQILRYKIQTGRTVDPITAVLAAEQTEKLTPREAAAMKRMLSDSLKK